MLDDLLGSRISFDDVFKQADVASPLNPLTRWLFIEGNRRHVAAVLGGLVLAVLVGFNFLTPIDVNRLLLETTTVQTLFNTLLSGVILLVSIVVSINSLVVQQELTPIGSQHERVIESWNFRTEAAKLVRSNVSPASPDEFLRTILEAIEFELDEIQDEVESTRGEAKEDLEAYLQDSRTGVERLHRALDQVRPGAVSVNMFEPRYEPSQHIERTRSFSTDRDEYSDAVVESMDEIVSALQYFSTAREYFKTVYYKREFSHLSRDLLYSGLPAILTVSYVLLALDAQFFVGQTLGIDNLLLFIAGAYVVALFPFLVLTAYIIRAAMIAENTVTAGGFILEQD